MSRRIDTAEAEPDDGNGDGVEFYARLMPYNPRAGFVTNRYHDGDRIWQGGVMPAWARITSAQAAALRGLTQEPDHVGSPPLFQVADAEERARIDALEEGHRQAVIANAAGVNLSVPSRPKPPPADFRSVQGGDITTANLPPVAGRQAALPYEE